MAADQKPGSDPTQNLGSVHPLRQRAFSSLLEKRSRGVNSTSRGNRQQLWLPSVWLCDPCRRKIKNILPAAGCTCTFTAPLHVNSAPSRMHPKKTTKTTRLKRQPECEAREKSWGKNQSISSLYTCCRCGVTKNLSHFTARRCKAVTEAQLDAAEVIRKLADIRNPIKNTLREEALSARKTML